MRSKLPVGAPIIEDTPIETLNEIDFRITQTMDDCSTMTGATNDGAHSSISVLTKPDTVVTDTSTTAVNGSVGGFNTRDAVIDTDLLLNEAMHESPPIIQDYEMRLTSGRLALIQSDFPSVKVGAPGSVLDSDIQSTTSSRRIKVPRAVISGPAPIHIRARDASRANHFVTPMISDPYGGTRIVRPSPPKNTTKHKSPAKNLTEERRLAAEEERIRLLAVKTEATRKKKDDEFQMQNEAYKKLLWIEKTKVILGTRDKVGATPKLHVEEPHRPAKGRENASPLRSNKGDHKHPTQLTRPACPSKAPAPEPFQSNPTLKNFITQKSLVRDRASSNSSPPRFLVSRSSSPRSTLTSSFGAFDPRPI